MIRTILMATTLMFSSNAMGAKVYGIGASTCQEWLDHIFPLKDHEFEKSWLLGWVSAAGYYEPKELVVMSPGKMADWVDDYCRAHRSDHVVDAAEALVRELRKPRTET